MTGLITGINASFSMAASEYLSTRQEKGKKGAAIKAAIKLGVSGISFLIGMLVKNVFGIEG